MAGVSAFAAASADGAGSSHCAAAAQEASLCDGRDLHLPLGRSGLVIERKPVCWQIGMALPLVDRLTEICKTGGIKSARSNISRLVKFEGVGSF